MSEISKNQKNMEIDVVEVTENVQQVKTITEGKAKILSKGHVFYNPVQEFNRDLSISVLTTFYNNYLQKEQTEQGNDVEKKNGKIGMRILEALSATGLRSIRYAKEVSGVREIIANDLSKSAVESIEENIKHNGVEGMVKANHSDAMTLMYLSTAQKDRFEAIDLDPYGCPNRFLDGAVQSLRDGGLLLVTATDMAVLTGNSPEACSAKYGTIPLKMKCCHEMAIRILLRCIEVHANRYGRYIVPLLSISADFYIRVFVRIFTSQLMCKRSMSKQSMVYQCVGCGVFTLQPLGIIQPNPTDQNPNQVKFSIPSGPYVNTHCDHCNHKHKLGGPIWSAPTFDPEFVTNLLTTIQSDQYKDLVTSRRMIGMLSVIEEELPDKPLYYCVDKLCSALKLESIPALKIRSALLHAGYRVSFSHAYRNSIKTDAPPEVLWDILRSWAKQHAVREDRMIDGSVVKAILEKQPTKEYNLTEIHPSANPKSRKDALSRFPANPTAHWGPGTRATLMIGKDKLLKSYRNQNKKQKHKSTDADAEQKTKSPDEKLLKIN